MLRRTASLTSIAFAVSVLTSTDASAAAQRTFVASYGSPANTAFNCSIAKPCRAFSDAIDVTTDGGEVIVLDSAGYGPVTITKPLSIIAPQGIYAGISVSGGTGITVNPGSGDVTLRNLTLVGLGGAHGIDFQSGDSLNLDGLTVSGFTNAGIKAQRTSTARISIQDTAIRRNGAYGATIGTSSGAMNADVRRSLFEGNGFAGLFFTDRVHGNVEDTAIKASVYGLVLQPVVPIAFAQDVVVCTRCAVTANSSAGFLVGSVCDVTAPVIYVVASEVVGNGAGLYAQACGTIIVSATTLSGNGVARKIDANGGLYTYVDNRVGYNASSGAPWGSFATFE